MAQIHSVLQFARVRFLPSGDERVFVLPPFAMPVVPERGPELVLYFGNLAAVKILGGVWMLPPARTADGSRSSPPLRLTVESAAALDNLPLERWTLADPSDRQPHG